MYYVYILRLNNRSLYVGFTDNLRKRIKNHNSGNTPYTRKYLPVELIFYTAFRFKSRALAFEKYLKSGSGIAFRNKRLV